MLSGAERTYRYEKRKRAAGLRKVHVMVPHDRVDELKAIAARMRAEHASQFEREKILKQLIRQKSRLRDRGVIGMHLLGSVARKEADRASDIDLLVALDPAGNLTILDLNGIEQDLEKLLGRPVNLIDRASLKPEVRSGMARDETKIF
jgi:predicted nucleotidyltransferase